MLCKSAKIYCPSYLSKVLPYLLVMSLVLSGCNPKPLKQIYDNTKSGILLEKPEAWDVTYNERNGFIILESKNGFWQKESARIEISGGACLPNTLSNIPDLEAEIERIRILYSLDKITIIQKPTKFESDQYEVSKATVSIPTVSMREDPKRIQVGEDGSDISQLIDIYTITDLGTTTFVYVYEGNDATLNEQAREIVNSIRLICKNEQ